MDDQEKEDYLKGKLCDMLFTQTGSRFIQKQFKTFTTFALNEIGDRINELMIDRYGNYFCQELISRCNSHQRLKILQSIQADFIKICTDK